MSAENVKQAYVMFNGQKVVATYDSETDLWVAEMTAPAESSWSQPDHVYLAEIHAEDQAGNTAIVTSSDSTYGDQLKIRVLEKTAPTVTILSPTSNAVLGDNNQTIKIEFFDQGGSGINISSTSLTINGTSIDLTDVSFDTEEDSNVYQLNYLAENLSDGINTVTFSVNDNDGNAGTSSVTFVISTSAPLLEVLTPTEGLITNASLVKVTGTATASNDYTNISEVTVNGNLATIGSDGSFEYDLTLTAGANVVTVVAKDSIGKTTSIVRNVTLDTEAPIITDVHAEATTVDASGIIKITFRVTDS